MAGQGAAPELLERLGIDAGASNVYFQIQAGTQTIGPV